jgi:hypothetical protein
MAESRRLGGALLLAAAFVTSNGAGDPAVHAPFPRAALAEHENVFHERGLGALRGVTVGPIESSLHPDRGYGSPAFLRTLEEVQRLGGSWVSLTPFGRVADLSPTGVAMTFEAPFRENRRALSRAVAQAHAAGIKVLLVPHLWVETGAWRGEIDPGSPAAWERWASGYTTFVREWAAFAEESGVDLLAVGVELRSWVTNGFAPSFSEVVREVRSVYGGPLTYAANWDDAEDTVIWGELDLIGVNAFFPLTESEDATPAELAKGGRAVAERVRALAERWHKPVVFTEFGYTTRQDPALRPWEWPDHMKNVVVDQAAQADAYSALLAGVIGEPWFAGAFVWRLYADPDDMSQESEWGFSPRGKLAELVLRDAFAAHWAADGKRPLGTSLVRHTAERIGIY